MPLKACITSTVCRAPINVFAGIIRTAHAAPFRANAPSTNHKPNSTTAEPRSHQMPHALKGRPSNRKGKTKEDAKRRTLSVRLRSDDYDLLKAQAKYKQVSMSQHVADLAREYPKIISS